MCPILRSVAPTARVAAVAALRVSILPANYNSRGESDQYQQPCIEREPALYAHSLVELLCLGLGIWGEAHC